MANRTVLRVQVLLLLLFVGTTQGQVIKNGDFETALANDGDLGWWIYEPCEPNQSVARVNEPGIVYNGEWSAKVDCNTPGYAGDEYDAKLGQGAYRYAAEGMTFPERNIYTLSFAYNVARSSPDPNTAMVEIRYWDSGWEVIGWENIYLPDTDSNWSPYDANLISPAETNYMEVVFRAGDVTTMYVDDVNIVIVGPVTDQAELVFPENGGWVTEEDSTNCGNGPTLQWEKAVFADGNHYVYLGTSLADVNDANINDPEYLGWTDVNDPCYTLSLDDIERAQEYFWRVDETVDGNVVKALFVWSFSVWNLTWIDTFGYGSNGEIQAVWGPNATVSDGNMQINYNSTNYEVSADACDLLCSTDVSENAMLVLLVKGHEDMNDNVYVKLESNNGAQSGVVQYPDANELNQQAHESFRTWAIDLQEFVSQGFDLTNLTKVIIGVTGSSAPSSSGTVSFNDARFDYAYCDEDDVTAELILADFDNNCWVGMQELEMLADDWLKAGYNISAGTYDMNVGLILWYKFDTGSGSTAVDSSGEDHNGTLMGDATWAPGYDGNCVSFPEPDPIGYLLSYIVVPADAAPNDLGGHSTVALWVKDVGIQTDTEKVPDDEIGSQLFQAGPSGQGNLQVFLAYNGYFEYICGWDIENEWGDSVSWGEDGYSNHEHPLNEWVHYAFVKDANEGLMRIYQNGKIVAEQDENTGLKMPDVDSDAGEDSSYFTIGAWRWYEGLGGYYWGLMDDFRLYNRALSQGEIMTLAGVDSLHQPVMSSAEVTGDDTVNFKDYAVVAAKWLEDPLLWPY